MVSEAQVLGAIVDSLDSLDEGPGSESKPLMNRTLAPSSVDSDTPPDSRASASGESSWPNASQVLALRPTLDPFESLASGQALTLMNLLSRKSWPWPLFWIH